MRRVPWALLATMLVVTLVIFGLGRLLGIWWTLGLVLGLVALLALASLAAAKTDVGRRAAAGVGRRVGRTRAGNRMARAQLRATAKRKGVPLTDPLGRPLTDVELQLELSDTAETRAIKRQLRTMNPQQRAQALRMMQAQAETAQRTGVPPTPMAPPRMPGVSGRPMTRPPRTKSRKKR
jgi:hypothetical protein